MTKIRLDDLLVLRELAEDRKHALALVMRGAVRVDDAPARKAGQLVDEAAEVRLQDLPRFVSRGGLKLDAALEGFAIDVTDRVCADLGASTGGFTDCLLQRGARRVYAFDVGRGQLDWNLRRDPRVLVREGVNVRHLSPDDIGEEVHLIVGDLSFISLRLILPVVRRFTGAQAVLLVKPQFEARPDEVGRGGDRTRLPEAGRDRATGARLCRRTRLGSSGTDDLPGSRPEGQPGILPLAGGVSGTAMMG